MKLKFFIQTYYHDMCDRELGWWPHSIDTEKETGRNGQRAGLNGIIGRTEKKIDEMFEKKLRV